MVTSNATFFKNCIEQTEGRKVRHINFDRYTEDGKNLFYVLFADGEEAEYDCFRAGTKEAFSVNIRRIR